MSARLPIPAEARKINGRRSALKRHHPDDREAIANLEREYRYLVLEDHVRRVLETAPPLTPAQRARLRDILAPSDAA